MSAHLRHLLVGTAQVDRGKVLLWQGMRTGLVFGLLAAACVAAEVPSYALSLAMGVVFVAFAEAGEESGRRWRTMAWVNAWIMLAALVGGLLSNAPVAGIIASGLVALGCGVAGVAGPRAALGGLLTLVTFTIFLGVPVLPAPALEGALLVGLGGAVITAVTVVPHLIDHPRALNGSLTPLPGLWARIRPQVRWEDPFLRHGLRLSALIVVATALAEFSGVEHSYWLPMTIAWVTKPDADGTVTRVAGRIVGTMLGLVVCAALLLPGYVSGYLAVLVCSIAAAVIVAFVAANYALTVGAITLLVVTLFAIDGDSVTTEIDVRLIATVLAAVMTIVASFAWRTRPGGTSG